MILFFRTREERVIAVATDHQLVQTEKDALCWLFGGAEMLAEERLEGRFVGPRREMITPWSTNAVEITQNMNLGGISRIEEFIPAPLLSPEGEVCKSDSESLPSGRLEGASSFDPMLQREYDGLDQEIFTIDIEPEPIRYIDDLEAYNEQEGLALSAEEIAYLHEIEQKN
ncbi:MAG: hypothetical protein IKZ83_00030, partial [Prevotella sp.]|nr:hypothetical protein [Prevotella sp.]